MTKVTYLFKERREVINEVPEDRLAGMLDLLDLNPDGSASSFAESLPFSANDTTAGAENELMAVVIGSKDTVDLPLMIEASNYYQNLMRRTSTGDTSKRLLLDLRRFLDSNTRQVWENSWVRFRMSMLSNYAKQVFNHDLLADKTNIQGMKRRDHNKFIYVQNGEPYIRIPISYLFKLALADVIASESFVSEDMRRLGERLMSHFLNDNTSPETFSFHPVSLRRASKMGKGLAAETLKRFFMCHLLLIYADRKFGLSGSGQRPLVYFAPNTPVRQKQLNDIISDSFYRELFMSPCLSGWNQGENKHHYMRLCHEVLSRSQLNAVLKLRDAGIITRNLVVLPSVSNVSLANNGTHISIGSKKLTRLLADKTSGFGMEPEKYLGDLVIKITEHFFPIFVGTYSAAPYRINFWDFHPENVLGFLPHELDFTHLRMIWRRWKKKASLKIFDQPVTPFGPKLMDQMISRTFGLKGDFVYDFRLLDYFVALMSTHQCPGFDGQIGNQARLKKDLAEMGVFDPSMAFYTLYRQREYSVMGFTGFEGRFYSAFEDITEDMGHAANLQTLITALAYQYILSGQIDHRHIPDDPFIESERRQIFFAAAIGIPTIFILKDTQNHFMKRILTYVKHSRMSRRYRGYLRVHVNEYLKALIEMICTDAADLISILGLDDTILDLKLRVTEPETYATAHRLTQGILNLSSAKHPLKLAGDEFNMAAEQYYREDLRRRHIRSGMDVLARDLKNLDAYAILGRGIYRETLYKILGGTDSSDFFESIRKDVESETINDDSLMKLIQLVLLTIHVDIHCYEQGEYP